LSAHAAGRIPPSRISTSRVRTATLGLVFLLLLSIRGLGWPVAAWWLHQVRAGSLTLSLSWLTSTRFLLLFAVLQCILFLATYSGQVVFALLRLRPPPPGLAPEALAMRHALERAALRYRGVRPWLFCYIVIKYWVDPCYAELARRIAPGEFLVDLGTGFGMLPVGLAERDPRQRALGIEWDNAKAHAGRFAAQDLPGIEIRSGDAWLAELPRCDVVTLIDVLHYHPLARQNELLRRAAAALTPGGRLLIRDLDAGQMNRSRWARFAERVNARFGWNRGGEIQFRTADELAGELRGMGFTVESLALDVRLFPGNMLLCAVKR
jgi:SAM-dependent methyltransferase